MKIALIQLSDIHCKYSDYDLTLKLEKAVCAIKSSTNIDKAVLIFTGDLVDTDTKEEYGVGRHLIGKFLSDLSKELKCGKIETVIVPGNHDMFLPKDSRTAADIEEWNLQEHLEEELSRQKNFFSYANGKNCFLEDKICDIKKLPIGDSKIQFCLLNSAPFSTRKPDDKQFHYFPVKVEENLTRKEDVDLKITIMHHHFEWCEWHSKEMLKKTLKSDDITFFGHDHKEEMLTTEYADGTGYNIIMGGRFHLEYNQKAAFNMIVYDSKEKVFERFFFNWSVEDSIFIPKKLKTMRKRNFGLIPSQEYLDNLLVDKQNVSNHFTDYYVFPKLSVEGDAFINEGETRAGEITSDEIFKALVKDKVIRITGGNGSGKSALIKYLYNHSIEKGFIPLLIEKRDYRDSKIDKMLKNLFEDQYAANTDGAYDKYVQSKDEQKIVFIDDVHLIKSQKARQILISSILESGKLLIYTTREKNQELEEIVKDKLQKKDISTVEIMPVYKETRDALIENIGGIQGKKTDEVDAIKFSLDYLAQSQTGLFTFAPDNVIQYIKFFMREGTKEKKGVQTISMVFETNIRNAILSACYPESTANKNLLALEFLADYMYFELETEKLTISDFEEFVKIYNEKKKTTINGKQFLETCVKANILKQGEESFDIGFYDKNTYAYFVAKAINTNFSRDPSNLTRISYVMDRICFGINDTIILFLSFITSNTNIIMKIAVEAKNLVSEYDEWNIDVKNIPFLHEVRDILRGVPSNEEKKTNHKHIEKIEKNRHEMIQFKSIFDYSEDDIKKSKYVLLKALKFTQLISRSLIDQYGSLDDDEVDTLVNVIFTVPQKVIYGMLKQTQDKIELLVQDILDFAKENITDQSIDETEVRQLLSQAGTTLALNIMNDIAFNAANESTIEVLRDNKSSSSNYKIMELMMEENVGNTSIFVEKAIDLAKEMKRNPYCSMLISLIARKHIMYTSGIDHRNIDKLLSGNVLSSKSKPTLLISQGKKEKN